MQDVLERLLSKINSSLIDPMPSENIFMEDVFTPKIYQEILQRLPNDEQYNFIEHPDAILPNGTKTRKLLDLTPSTIQKLNSQDQTFWNELNKLLTSNALRETLMKKFGQSITQRFGEVWPEMVTVPILYRDFPGYHIGIHTDAPYKLATLQFYFPSDLTQLHLGTSFHQRQEGKFSLLKTNPFKPNSAYAFVRTEQSWHSVNRLAIYESRRDSLALTIYLKGHEYSSEKTY